jgi:elongation factor Ts
MAQITAALVKTLRERTGAGMMDCKKALSAVDGDLDKAVDFLREKGLSQAAKKASRIAAEGAVASYVSPDAKVGVIVEVNCETDFVAKTDDFKALVSSIAEHIAKTNPKDVEALKASEMNGKKVADVITEKIAKIGENISLRRFVRYQLTDGLVAAYVHAGGKIGVLVDLKGDDAVLGKDIAMQVAATNPAYLNRTQVPAEVLDHEKEVLSEQAKNEGKPEKIIEKMVMGRIQKYYKENCLVDQEFVKDPDTTITKLLKAHNNAEIRAYARFQLGEGIEKKQENFAEEVKSFIK